MSDVKSFVSCLTWVKKGVAKRFPEKLTLTRRDLSNLVRPTNEERDESDSEDEYNFASYDDEIDPLDIRNVVALGDDDEELEEEDTDDDNDEIKETDNLLVVGSSHENYDMLDVYVSNYLERDCFVHHNIIIRSCPLSLEWLNYESRHESGNFLALGMMSPEIEVWDLDVMNPFEPVFKLGYKATSRKYAHRNYGHKESVLTLSWNHNFPHIMASGSADETVILWDIDTRKQSTTIRSYEGNVESVAWHPVEGQILLTGSADRCMKVLDCRYDDSSSFWTFDGEINEAKWNKDNLFEAWAGTSRGSIHCIDVRAQSAVWTTEAIGSAITGLDSNPDVPGMLVTSHVDGYLRLWDIRNSSPLLVETVSGGVDTIHCLAICPDSPHIGAMGGTKKNKTLTICSFNEFEEVQKHWNLATE